MCARDGVGESRDAEDHLIDAENSEDKQSTQRLSCIWNGCLVYGPDEAPNAKPNPRDEQTYWHHMIA